MVSSFDAMEVRRLWQQSPYEPGVSRVGNGFILSAGPELHRQVDIGETVGIKSKSQAGRRNYRGGNASIMAPYGR